MVTTSSDRSGGAGGAEGRPRDLSALAVGRRLEALRRLGGVERDEDARARLARERPGRSEPFAVGVERRLRELRALDELATYLHQKPGLR
jgi:hypothetical protein